MPKLAKELGPLAVGRIKLGEEVEGKDGKKKPVTPGPYAVGGVPGLMLLVSDTGGRSWILRARIGSKRRDIGLGGYPAVPLADARCKAREIKDRIKAGGDPVMESKAAKSRLLAEQTHHVTFADATQGFLKEKSDEWRHSKTSAHWAFTMAEYAFPFIGNMLVKDIDVPHILNVLQPIWKEKTVTASKLRGRIEQVMAWATVHKHRQGPNPATWRGNLDQVLAKPGRRFSG